MTAMGYLPGQGLGREGQGVTEAVVASGKTDTAGLGATTKKPPPLKRKNASLLPPPPVPKKKKPRPDDAKTLRSRAVAGAEAAENLRHRLAALQDVRARHLAHRVPFRRERDIHALQAELDALDRQTRDLRFLVDLRDDHNRDLKHVF